MDPRALDWLTELALQAAARDESMTPAVVTLLLRRYLATGRDDVRDALGPALARAIDACESLERSTSPELPPSPGLRRVSPELAQSSASGGGKLGPTYEASYEGRAEWLMVFVEACTFSEDERVLAAAHSLIATLRGGWPSRRDLRSAMQSIDACLSAAGRLPNTDTVVPAAIDELEHVVGVVYEPGEGLLRSIDQKSGEPGNLRDHIAAVSALLTAYAITGRLPYSMLAEELTQFSRRTWWDSSRGGFWRLEPAPNVERRTISSDAEPFVANCHASRVLCRLAALHEDPEYRAVAVIAHQSDYQDDARRTLESLAASYRDHGLDAAVYGLALEEWLAVLHTHDSS